MTGRLRFGQVTQSYDHGTVIIWDLQNERGFPAYCNDLRIGDVVSFSLNEDETMVQVLKRISVSELPMNVDPIIDTQKSN